jgi:hypothetical protein
MNGTLLKELTRERAQRDSTEKTSEYGLNQQYHDEESICNPFMH